MLLPGCSCLRRAGMSKGTTQKPLWSWSYFFKEGNWLKYPPQDGKKSPRKNFDFVCITRFFFPVTGHTMWKMVRTKILSIVLKRMMTLALVCSSNFPTSHTSAYKELLQNLIYKLVDLYIEAYRKYSSLMHRKQIPTKSTALHPKWTVHFNKEE